MASRIIGIICICLLASCVATIFIHTGIVLLTLGSICMLQQVRIILMQEEKKEVQSQLTFYITFIQSHLRKFRGGNVNGNICK